MGILDGQSNHRKGCISNQVLSTTATRILPHPISISPKKLQGDPHNLADLVSFSHHKFVFDRRQCNPKFRNADSIVGDDVVRGLRAVEI